MSLYGLLGSVTHTQCLIYFYILTDNLGIMWLFYPSPPLPWPHRPAAMTLEHDVASIEHIRSLPRRRRAAAAAASAATASTNATLTAPTLHFCPCRRADATLPNTLPLPPKSRIRQAATFAAKLATIPALLVVPANVRRHG